MFIHLRLAAILQLLLALPFRFSEQPRLHAMKDKGYRTWEVPLLELRVQVPYGCAEYCLRYSQCRLTIFYFKDIGYGQEVTLVNIF